MRVVQRQGVLVADVDITAPGADGVGADEHALQDRVRVALEDAAIHVGSRIAFVGVADDKPLVTWCVPAALPLPPGRESAAASAAQSGSLHLLDDLLRRQFGEHLREGAVATQGDVVLDRARIDELVLTQEHAVLCRVEGDLGLLLVRLAVMRVDVDEPLYHIVTCDRYGDDLAHVLGRHMTVECAGRLDHHQGALLAEPVASGDANPHRIAESLTLDLVLQSIGDAKAVRCPACGVAAYGDGLRHAVGRGEFLATPMQLGGRCDPKHE